jgi:hypothetical protein
MHVTGRGRSGRPHASHERCSKTLMQRYHSTQTQLSALTRLNLPCLELKFGNFPAGLPASLAIAPNASTSVLPHAQERHLLLEVGKTKDCQVYSCKLRCLLYCRFEAGLIRYTRCSLPTPSLPFKMDQIHSRVYIYKSSLRCFSSLSAHPQHRCPLELLSIYSTVYRIQFLRTQTREPWPPPPTLRTKAPSHSVTRPPKGHLSIGLRRFFPHERTIIVESLGKTCS